MIMCGAPLGLRSVGRKQYFVMDPGLATGRSHLSGRKEKGVSGSTRALGSELMLS